MSRLLIVSDAWEPQVNGVVRTIRETKRVLERQGHEVRVIGPQEFRTVPLPSYGEIRLAVRPRRQLETIIEAFHPDAIHIATEGPLGLAARRICNQQGEPFTTAVHTRFPEYLRDRLPVPTALSYSWMRRFHNAAATTMVATPSLESDLNRRGFAHLRQWTRGVDMELFQRLPGGFEDLLRPVMLCVGRVATEKNLEAFLDLDLAGTKVVVGDGPQRRHLERRYQNALFPGPQTGGALAQSYSGADVFVFPSRSDTFGLVLAESLACGTPVAAYPVAGPRDVLQGQSPREPVGVLDNDLGKAIRHALALQIPPERCRAFVAARYTWDIATDQFSAIAFGPRSPQSGSGVSI